jgi:tetratricopeptide (TPR) repeat protein
MQPPKLSVHGYTALMRKCTLFVFAALSCTVTRAQDMHQQDYTFSLPTHPGRLHLEAPTFKIVEASAKPDGNEFGLRGQNPDASVSLLVFLFRIPEEAPLTSAKCRDSMLSHAQRADPSIHIQLEKVLPAGNVPLALAQYFENARQQHVVRTFVAQGDLCSDIEFSSTQEVTADMADIKAILASVTFDPDAKPSFREVFAYATVLFDHKMVKAAAPIYEQSLSLLPPDEAAAKWRRISTDQAVMAYGMSGDIAKSRSLLATAIRVDPQYPMNYYNLACADAEEGDVSGARLHLQQSFARRENVIPGESLPDPTQDDSIRKLRNDKSFWLFVESLQKDR